MANRRLLDVTVSIALLASLIALGWFAIGQPLHNWRAAKIEGRITTIAELQKLQARIATLRAERGRYDEDGALDVIWQAERSGTATAMIQSEVSRMALAEGISLLSISPVRQRELSLANSVGIRIELEAPLDQLSEFLRVVEYHAPSLLVERATLRRLPSPEPRSEQPLVFAQINLSAPVLFTVEGKP